MPEFAPISNREGRTTVELFPNAGAVIVVSTLTPQAIPTSAPPTQVFFDDDPDFNDFGADFYDAEKGLFVIPDGSTITRVQLFIKGIWDAAATGFRSISTSQDGAFTAGVTDATFFIPGAGDPTFGLTIVGTSGPLAASPGKTFGVIASQNSGAPLDLNGTSFALTVLR